MHSAVILAGGLGTRLQPTVPHLPKALAPIRGVPFLKILIDQLEKSDLFSEIVLALGHRAEMIQGTFSSEKKIRFSVEKTPLGTGGALLLAAEKASSETLCVLNGDSLSALDFAAFFRFHREQGRPVTIACKHLEETARFGTVQFDGEQKVTSFQEKRGASSSGWVSVGIYAIEKSILKQFPHGYSSLEQDLFPRLLYDGISAYPYEGPFIDIGTEESYTQAQEIISL